MLWYQCVFLTYGVNKIKNCLYIIIGYNTFLHVALAIIKILGHFNLDSLGPQGNHLVDIFSRNSALKVTGSSQIFHAPRVYFPNDNLEKLAREARQLASEK